MQTLSELTLNYVQKDYGTTVTASLSNSDLFEEGDTFNLWGLFQLFADTENDYPAYLLTCSCGDAGCGGFTPFIRVKNKDKSILMVKYNDPLTYPMGSRDEFKMWVKNRKMKILRIDLKQMLSEIEKLIARFEQIAKDKEKIPFFSASEHTHSDEGYSTSYWIKAWKDYSNLVQRMKEELNHVYDVLQKEGRIKITIE